MARGIVWTPEAEKSRQDIFSYWNIRNKSNLYSLKLNDEIVSTLNLLSENPVIGKQTKYPEFRRYRLHNYQIVFKYNPEHLVVIAIQDLRQEHLKP